MKAVRNENKENSERTLQGQRSRERVTAYFGAVQLKSGKY